MSDWIDRVSAQFEKQQEDSQRFSQVLTPQASRAWQSLSQILKRHADRINAQHRQSLGSLDVDATKQDVIEITKNKYPKYKVTLTLELVGKKIAIHGYIIYELDSLKNFDVSRLALELDSNGTLTILDHDRAPLELEKISEMILTPIFLGLEPYPHNK